jgi:hypothetical protein
MDVARFANTDTSRGDCMSPLHTGIGGASEAVVDIETGSTPVHTIEPAVVVP